MFSEKEIAYLQSQRLARIATVSSNGEPDVAPVGFTFDRDRFLIGGIDLRRTPESFMVMVTLAKRNISKLHLSAIGAGGSKRRHLLMESRS
jgi:hypothetical protein